MLKPDTPPTDAGSQESRRISTVNGLLVGLGFGLLSRDWMDLNPDDFTPLFGWRNGIVICTLIGIAAGYLRRDKLAWKLLLLLGVGQLSTGLTIAFTTFAGHAWNMYTIGMPTAGIAYVLIGATIGILQLPRQASRLKWM